MSCSNTICPFQLVNGKDQMQCMVSDAAHTASFESGEVLFLQGEPSTNLYSLSSGMVKIFCNTLGGREQIIGLSHPGNLLVGLQSIAESHYAYSATAATPVTACRIDHEKLLKKVSQRGDVAITLIRSLNSQLAYSRSLMEVMGQKSADAKIASLILLMVPEMQHGDVEFSLPFSRREIANFLNLSEETVCRRMAGMQRAGIIKAPRRFVSILDRDQLYAMTDGSRGGCPGGASPQPADPPSGESGRRTRET